MTRLWTAGLALAAVALVAAGCGSGGGSTVTSTPTYGAKAPAAKAPAAKISRPVITTRHLGLGTVLVDGSGRTVYLFEKDKGGTSACDGACASAWPPVTTAAAGARAAGRRRRRGEAQHDQARRRQPRGDLRRPPALPLRGDAKPGQASGQGLDQFGAEWYVLGRSGSKIDEG